MVHVLASLRVKAGCMPELVRIFKANVPNVLREKGCIEYVRFPLFFVCQRVDFMLPVFPVVVP